MFDSEETGDRSTASKIVQYVIVGFGVLLTVYTMWYIYRELKRVRPIIVEEFAQRKAANAGLETAEVALSPVAPNRQSRGYTRFGNDRDGPSESTTTLNAPLAERDIHLAPHQYDQRSQYAYRPSRTPSPAPTYTTHAQPGYRDPHQTQPVYQQPVYSQPVYQERAYAQPQPVYAPSPTRPINFSRPHTHLYGQ